MSEPRAWVVKCRGCGCTVTCRADDPQAHMEAAEPRPQCRLLVTCSCCWSAWLYKPEDMFNGQPAPSANCPIRARQSRTDNAKLIAASVIAAIRLNREEIKNSPVVRAKVGDSLRLADMILEELKRSGPKR